MENTALTNATRASPPKPTETQLSADCELDVSMIVDKIQHLKSRLRSNSDKFEKPSDMCGNKPVSYTHLRAHETKAKLVCRLLLEKKKLKS